MSNKKTINQWYTEGLEEPYRTKAINYANYFGMSNKRVSSLYEALKQGFVWQYTQENVDYPGYWNSLSQKILINERKSNNE